jgi:hypothetical protein
MFTWIAVALFGSTVLGLVVGWALCEWYQTSPPAPERDYVLSEPPPGVSACRRPPFDWARDEGAAR